MASLSSIHFLGRNTMFPFQPIPTTVVVLYSFDEMLRQYGLAKVAVKGVDEPPLKAEPVEPLTASELAVKYFDLPRKLAERRFRKISRQRRRGLDVDDWESDAFLGLAEAVENHDPKNGGSFEAYASSIIWSRMIDGERKRSLTTYTERQKIKAGELTPSEAERGRRTCFIGLATESAALVAPEASEPCEHRLKEAIEAHLTDDETEVIVGLYENQMSQKEVGKQLTLSQSQVSRLKLEAIEKLKCLGADVLNEKLFGGRPLAI